MKILSKQNFNQNESKNFVVDNLSSAPSNPILGQVYYNTQNERAYVCIKSGETPEWADLSLQEEVSIGGEEPNGRDIKIWINPEDMASSSDYGSLPIGSIIPYSGETAPEGYSICDGKELNRETYKELFSIIGTTFGNGDGTSTFNLPDLKGRISVGLDSSDTDFDSLGKTGGSKYLQKHSHQQIAFDSWGSGVSAAHLGTDALAGMTSSNQAYVGGRSTLEAGTGNSGNLQPYIVLNYIIKIYGEAMLTGDVIDSLEGDSSYSAPSIHAVNKGLRAVNEGLGNIKGKILWTNPNPTAGFPAQTITLNSDDYDTYKVYYYISSSNLQVLTSESIKGHGTRLMIPSITMEHRPVDASDNTHLHVGLPINTQQPVHGIPIYIVGYKTGLFDNTAT